MSEPASKTRMDARGSMLPLLLGRAVVHGRLAWRNIWRNPRRTGVILLAVVTGVWSMLLLGALMRGMEIDMLQNGLNTLTGHLQIRHPRYRSDPSIANRIGRPQEVLGLLPALLPPGSRWTERVRVSAVASNARHSAGVTLVGIEPGAEAQMSFVRAAMSRGRYLEAAEPRGILLGEALLEKFETRPGHKMILMSQAADGEIASRAFRIVGIFRAAMRDTEKQYVFVSRAAAQEMLALDGDVTEISIFLPEARTAGQAADTLARRLPAERYRVQSWRALLPMLDVYLEIFDGFILIWYVVVFIAMAFGIVNTTLMAIFERMREFGLLKALGLKPMGIIRDVLTEAGLLLVVGMLIGNVFAALSVRALAGPGIDLSALAAGAEFAGISRTIYPALQARDLIGANLVVLVLGLVVCLYPAVKAARITPVAALAHT